MLDYDTQRKEVKMASKYFRALAQQPCWHLEGEGIRIHTASCPWSWCPARWTGWGRARPAPATAASSCNQNNISAFQLYSFSAFHLYSIKALQHFSFAELQLYNISALQHFRFTAFQPAPSMAVSSCSQNNFSALHNLDEYEGKNPDRPASKQDLLFFQKVQSC